MAEILVRIQIFAPNGAKICSCCRTRIRRCCPKADFASQNTGARFSHSPANNYIVAGLGFEPRYSPPKGNVLPLDDPAIKSVLHFSLYAFSFYHISQSQPFQEEADKKTNTSFLLRHQLKYTQFS